MAQSAQRHLACDHSDRKGCPARALLPILGGKMDLETRHEQLLDWAAEQRETDQRRQTFGKVYAPAPCENVFSKTPCSCDGCVDWQRNLDGFE